MHRTGTSLLTRILNISGMAIGKKEELIGIGKGNPTGHWENKAFVKINEKIISTFKKGSNWHEIPDYPTNWLKNPKVISLEKKAKELVEKMNNRYKIWGWKDPRTCITLPFWQKIIGNDLVYVVILRNPLDVAKSLKKVHNLSNNKSILLWARYYLTILNNLEGKKYSFIHSERLLSNWENETKKILKHINSPYLTNNDDTRRKINNFIKPNTWHYNTKTKYSFFKLPNNLQLALIDYLYASTNKVKKTLEKSLININQQWEDSSRQLKNRLDNRSKQLRVTKKKLASAKIKIGKTGEEIFFLINKQTKNINELKLKSKNMHQKLRKQKQIDKENEKTIEAFRIHSQNLKKILDNIQSAKTFKIWQTYNKIKKVPKFVTKGFKYIYKNGFNSIFKKLEYKNFTTTYKNQIRLNYSKWFQENYPSNKQLKAQSNTEFKYRPLISIITPVYNTDKKWLIKCIESVINQSYSNWQLCLADDHSTKPYIKKILKEFAHNDSRIKVIFRKKNGHISKASNSALKMASGKFVGLLDHDDEIWPNALFEIVKLLNSHRNADFIYSDEDKIEMDSTHTNPFFKPNYSPDFLLSTNYITHFSVIRKKLIDDIGGFRTGYEGSQDYDLFLRTITKTRNIFHIPSILYSWRKIPNSTASVYTVKNYAHQAAIKALSNYLQQNNIKATVGKGLKLGTFKINYKILGNPKISIIIPTKDKTNLLKKCINSIVKKTTYKNYEILVVDTGSQKSISQKYFRHIGKNKNIKVLKWKNATFNFSKVNNFAASKADGEYLLFLNNDTQVINSSWLAEMLKLAQLKRAGPVGAKLLYPNKKIQHAGIEILSNNWPHHFSINYPDTEPYGFPYQNYKDIIKNPSAITGACLIISKKKFNSLNGFDENYPLEFQDVILSIKAKQVGLFPIYTPYAKLIHHESQTIKTDFNWNRIMSKFKEFKTLFPNFQSSFNNNIEFIDPGTFSAFTQINRLYIQYQSGQNQNNPTKSNKPKILFITHLYWPSIGGAEKLFQNLAEKMSKKFDVTLLSSDVTSTDHYFKPRSSRKIIAQSEETINRVKIIRANTDPNSIFYNLWNRLGRKFQNLWLNYTPLFFGPFFKRNIIKKLKKENWEWIICGPTPTSTIYYGWLMKKWTNSKLIVIPCMHTEDKLHTATHSISLIKKASLVLTLTKNEDRFLISKDVNKNKILTIGVGVDDYLLQSPKQAYSEKDYILYIGQEGAHKNIPLLINAMKKIWNKGYNNKLIIAGARTTISPQIDQIISQLNHKYKSKIVRINNFTDQQKTSLLDNCLVMVNPSSYESFGIVFIEAWARKKPVIGANIPAVRDLISDTQDGFLFKNKNVNSLTNKLIKIIENESDTLKMAVNGYEKVIKKYKWSNIIKNIIKHL